MDHPPRLALLTHASPQYAPRTRANAARSDLTVAFALDFSTAGEQLTRRAAGDRYIALDLATDSMTIARALFRRLRADARPSPILNVAGNGLHTLCKHGWTQDRVDRKVYEVLSVIHAHWPLSMIVSGGQTGADLAGLIAAVALGIPASGLLPAGFLMRLADGKDYHFNEEQLREQIERAAGELCVAK